jgi:hypothetical protein
MRLHRGRRDAMRVLHDQRGEAGGSACSRVARVVALKKFTVRKARNSTRTFQAASLTPKSDELILTRKFRDDNGT